MTNDVAIIGVGLHPFGRFEGKSAMEMGVDAVLVNTAIAVAVDPVGMGTAFRLGVEAGRRAFVARTGVVADVATASSPLTGFLDRLQTSQADPAVTAP